jgi:hypothetical protein
LPDPPPGSLTRSKNAALTLAFWRLQPTTNRAHSPHAPFGTSSSPSNYLYSSHCASSTPLFHSRPYGIPAFACRSCFQGDFSMGRVARFLLSRRRWNTVVAPVTRSRFTGRPPTFGRTGHTWEIAPTFHRQGPLLRCVPPLRLHYRHLGVESRPRSGPRDLRSLRSQPPIPIPLRDQGVLRRLFPRHY